jgi:tRNA(adenine34) deaminase
MKYTIELAKKAFEKGDVPVGAIVVKNGDIIGEGHNEKEIFKDPTMHAELIALKNAAKYVGDWRLNDCTLYSTLEPCIMCAGAILHFRIQRVVFGVTEPKFGGVVTKAALFDIDTLNHKVRYSVGIFEEEIKELMKRFFKKRRKSD